jgi:hypothetical protein
MSWGPVTYDAIAHSMQGLRVHLFARFDLDEPHSGADDCFCDGFSISRVVLVRLHKWFDELSRNDPDGVAELAQPSRHPLRAWASLHANQSFWGGCKKREEGIT